jgi:hypothetical protein
MAQKTAVEWLEEQFLRERFVYDFDFDKAKEMEKQQIEDAWDRGKYIGESFPQKQIEPEYEQDAEEYYTQTYGK